jgi:hypothetical protein
MVDKVSIVNMALSEIGHFTTFSLDANDDLADAVHQSWQRAIDHCVSLHDWKDFRRTRKLRRLTDAPETGWTYAHELPGDRVGEPLKILSQAGQSPVPLREFDREENLILCETQDVWARCKVILEPVSWDGGWRAAFVMALAGYLAVPVLQSEDMKEKKHRNAFGTPSQEGAGGMFGRLMAQDRASAPIGSPIADADPLSQAHGAGRRMSGPWYGGC